ncbi:Protein of unknown function [Ekhidna lutea]|uniref:DUF4199 domain-containing protein n=1 Tax=Ekhidna lutea TaxID=447679 RepID=A0A239K5V7_EKHLU|nr:DUF4199 domain-containing protein [Ekhidna lutea]SNT13757.1 Protein of unknown function [Ekhidna lutea]
MVKPALKYSILCGVFLIGLFFISINFGSNPLLDSRHFWFDLGVYFLFIFFAGKEHKDFRNGGFLHFWQGITIGFIVFIPAVLLFEGTLYLTLNVDSDLMEAYREGARALLKQNEEFYMEELGEAALKERYDAISDMTPAQLIQMTFRNKLFSAFLITPVVAIILRKKPK